MLFVESKASTIHNPDIMAGPLETFAMRLKKLRKEKNLRQDDVAVELNVSRQTISKYERAEREPDFDMLFKIAIYFDVSIDYLFGRSRSRRVNYLDDNALEWFWSMRVAEEPEKR
ncbi:MAG: helix-turn-helix transcriptional regulator [Eubacteriales bacterium]|nr:helix-turn-helix transcriptional regulator [Eubacteriales bacterium]MDD3540717.1 helix-turn-helix transcriptional regulator [Eubacteriales bacterium]